jgi:hypothetical protein
MLSVQHQSLLTAVSVSYLAFAINHYLLLSALLALPLPSIITYCCQRYLPCLCHQ